ncbi:hypothetical protein [Kitasatospora sp. HPMI-4]|uniref:hypothetical protein n=1 Tax=Kitasatospora sp. HPMI-4 TaxID=3448443 RepID=UPI003F1AED01
MTGRQESPRHPRSGRAEYTNAAPRELAMDWVEPFERLHGVVRVGLSNLIRHRLPRKYRPPKPRTPRSERDKWISRIIAVVVVPLLLYYLLQIIGAFLWEWTWAFIRVVRRSFRGRAFVGGWGSRAGQVVIDVRTGEDWSYENESALIAFTDHRILLVGASRGGLLGEFPRKELIWVDIRHLGLSERVDLHFADQSMVAVEAGREVAEQLRELSGSRPR